MNAIAENLHVPGIAETMMLVVLESGKPAATKRDRAAEKAAIDDLVAKGATREDAEKAIHCRVDLYPDGELKKINQPFNRFDTYLRENAIGWKLGRGQQLCSVHKVDDIESRYNQALLAWLPLVEKFCDGHAERVERICVRYPNLRATDFPSEGDIRNRFRFNLTFMAIQNPNDFEAMGGLNERQKSEMKERLSQALDAAAHDATADFAKKLQKELRSFIRGSSGDKGTRFSSEAWLRKLTAFVESRLNVTNNPDVNAALDDIQRVVSEVREYEQTADKGLQKLCKLEASRQAQQAVNKLAAFS
jgi:hypothetical protein